VVLGNGYNSSNGAPVLMIQYLDGTKSVIKLSPCTGITGCTFKGDNGLSSPQLIDLNGDGRVDVAYAGDLKGNLWKFDLTSNIATNWKVSFSNQPFFVAKGPATASARPAATVQQSITSAPYWMAHPLGGIMVSVGTGRNLTDADPTSTGIDSYYALWDNSKFTVSSGGIITLTDGTPINTISSTELPTTTGGLVKQTITGNIDQTGYYSSSNNPVVYSSSPTDSTLPRRGWYMDLALSTGERVLVNTRLFSGQTIIMTSTVPKKGSAGTVDESCIPGKTIVETNYLYFLNMFTGEQPSGTPFDTTEVTTNGTAPNILALPGGDMALVGSSSTVDKFLIPPDCPKDTICDPTKLKPAKVPGKRAGWRRKL
jgi:type IV pilus assembly protein PilY1